MPLRTDSKVLLALALPALTACSAARSPGVRNGGKKAAEEAAKVFEETRAKPSAPGSEWPTTPASAPSPIRDERRELIPAPVKEHAGEAGREGLKIGNEWLTANSSASRD